MKTFRLVLIFLGFLTLGVIVALLLSPKQLSYHSSIDIDLPASEVWDAYTDLAFMPLWIESLDSVYYTTDGEPGENSVMTLVYTQNENTVEVTETVQTWLEDQLLVTKTSVGDLMEINNDVRFEQTAIDKTTIEFSSEVKALNWIMRFSLWGSEETMIERNEQRLQKFAEQLKLRNSG